MRFKTISIMLIPTLIAVLILACGDTSPTGEVDHEHVINALISHDAATSMITTYFELARDGKALIAATVTVDTVNQVTSNADGTFTRQFSPSLFGDTVQIDVKSAIDEFSFRTLIPIPDTFSFEVTGLAGNVVHASTSPVKLTWTHSRLEEGYMIIVKPSNPAGTAVGYSNILSPGEYVVEGQYYTASIPKDTYLNTQGEFQTGDYNVWIAAYYGSPINYTGLPFTLPIGFTGNVSRVGVTGQIGTIYITAKTVLTAE